ncbi:hypothetical protein [Priestia taiwanensis]|uniref:Uncharacterized protein n=1 Tax=Priestia taiwanensis TaxID=1347902 RepID=A0A917ERD4_9BACI|nr:hypothetical protein [Priestia taiwanensis]MBM7363921.1 putative copper export protein [Priestia taiwanensis]GGE70114.1 hypothetical protein GCM10007140_20120 [Priestia taiwanensis]
MDMFMLFKIFLGIVVIALGVFMIRRLRKKGVYGKEKADGYLLGLVALELILLPLLLILLKGS